MAICVNSYYKSTISNCGEEGLYNLLQTSQVPPLGQLQSAVSSVIHDILDSDCAAECAASNSLEALKQTLASLSNDMLLEILLSALKTK